MEPNHNGWGNFVFAGVVTQSAGSFSVYWSVNSRKILVTAHKYPADKITLVNLITTASDPQDALETAKRMPLEQYTRNTDK